MAIVHYYDRHLATGRSHEQADAGYIAVSLSLAKGAYRARKSALTVDQVNTIRKRAAAGERKATLAREYKISRETLYQALRPGYAAIDKGQMAQTFRRTDLSLSTDAHRASGGHATGPR